MKTVTACLAAEAIAIVAVLTNRDEAIGFIILAGLIFMAIGVAAYIIKLKR